MFLNYTKEFEIEFQNMNYLSHFQASDQKISFTKCFSFSPRSSKLIFITGNGIIQTGNGIIYPISRPLMKKKSFTKSSPYLPRSSKWIFKTGNGIIQTGNGIISFTSRPLIKKLLLQQHLLQHLLLITQEVQNWFSKQEMELSKQEKELFFPIL